MAGGSMKKSSNNGIDPVQTLENVPLGTIEAGELSTVAGTVAAQTRDSYVAGEDPVYDRIDQMVTNRLETFLETFNVFQVRREDEILAKLLKEIAKDAISIKKRRTGKTGSYLR